MPISQGCFQLVQFRGKKTIPTLSHSKASQCPGALSNNKRTQMSAKAHHPWFRPSPSVVFGLICKNPFTIWVVPIHTWNNYKTHNSLFNSHKVQAFRNIFHPCKDCHTIISWETNTGYKYVKNNLPLGSHFTPATSITLTPFGTNHTNPKVYTNYLSNPLSVY